MYTVVCKKSLWMWPERRRFACTKQLYLNNFPPLPSSSLCPAPPSHTCSLLVRYKPQNTTLSASVQDQTASCHSSKLWSGRQGRWYDNRSGSSSLTHTNTGADCVTITWSLKEVRPTYTTFSFPLFSPLPAQTFAKKCQNLSEHICIFCL